MYFGSLQTLVISVVTNTDRKCSCATIPTLERTCTEKVLVLEKYNY